MNLSFPDWSIQRLKGVMEDVLVRVDRFYYLVDFIVLDTEPPRRRVNYVSIILKKPFRQQQMPSSIVKMG